jgi:hypothetical protein
MSAKGKHGLVFRLVILLRPRDRIRTVRYAGADTIVVFVDTLRIIHLVDVGVRSRTAFSLFTSPAESMHT